MSAQTEFKASISENMLVCKLLKKVLGAKNYGTMRLVTKNLTKGQRLYAMLSLIMKTVLLKSKNRFLGFVKMSGQDADRIRNLVFKNLEMMN